MKNVRKAATGLAAAALLFTAPAQAEEWVPAIDIYGGITAVFQGTSGNNTNSTRDASDFTHTLDINVDAEIAPDQMVLLHIETGEGDGAEPILGSSNITPNYDPNPTPNGGAQQTLTVSQAFYEGTFGDGLLVLSIGKMDIHSLYDENEFSGDETTQFMSGIFARLTGTLFPELTDYYAKGVRVLLAPADILEISYIMANPNNANFGTNIFQAVQLNLKSNFGGLAGNYRIYATMDDSVHDFDEDGTVETFTKTTGERTKNNGYGISFDQLVSDNVGLFLRYGVQDDQVAQNAAKSAMSLGVNIGGGAWGRDDDALGIGYGTVNNNTKVVGSAFSDQSVAEVFYRIQVADRIGLTPDIQFHNNLQRAEKKSVTVFALRAQLDF